MMKYALILAVMIGFACMLSWKSNSRAPNQGNSGTVRVTNTFGKGAEDLERDIHSNVPLGADRSSVESYLREQGMEFSFVPSVGTLYAIARKLKGSNRLISKSLQIQFHFDHSERVNSIETKVAYTGP